MISEEFKTKLNEIRIKNTNKNLPQPNYVVYEDKIWNVTYKFSQSNHEKYLSVAPVGKAIAIKDIITDEETGIQKVSLSYITHNGTKKSHTCQLKVISNIRTIVDLADYGVDVNSQNAKDVMLHLRNLLYIASNKSALSKCGFVEYNDKKIFMGAKCILKPKTKEDCQLPVYSGEFALYSEGDFETYKEMLSNSVIGHKYMETALLIGLSAPVIGLVGEDCGVQNILAHFSGESTTGKSTALKLIASIFGSPYDRDEKRGLFTTWNSTTNAVMEALSGNVGIPFTIDEAGMASSRDFGKIIYTIMEGKEKSRMTFGQGNDKVRTWRTAIISSGEIPLSANDDKATGLLIRLMSFEGIRWTEDASHSDSINGCINKNYGLLGYEFVKMLFKIKKESLLKSQQKEAKVIEKQLECGKYNLRIANMLSMIIVAGKILKKMGFPVNLKADRSFLVKVINETKAAEMNLGERAFRELKEYISLNQEFFEWRSLNGSVMVNHIARQPLVGVVYAIDKKDGNSTSIRDVAIPQKKCDEILKERGFKNTAQVYTQMRDSGLIKTNSRNRIIYPIKIGGVDKVDCIRILIQGDDSNNTNEAEAEAYTPLGTFASESRNGYPYSSKQKVNSVMNEVNSMLDEG